MKTLSRSILALTGITFSVLALSACGHGGKPEEKKKPSPVSTALEKLKEAECPNKIALGVFPSTWSRVTLAELEENQGSFRYELDQVDYYFAVLGKDEELSSGMLSFEFDPNQEDPTSAAPTCMSIRDAEATANHLVMMPAVIESGAKVTAHRSVQVANLNQGATLTSRILGSDGVLALESEGNAPLKGMDTLKTMDASGKEAAKKLEGQYESEFYMEGVNLVHRVLMVQKTENGYVERLTSAHYRPATAPNKTDNKTP